MEERPSKEEQKVALESYNALRETLKQLTTETPNIEIEETSEKIRIPLKALKLLSKILEVTSQGRPISIMPIASEFTTQAAADYLRCSRPHLVKLLEEGVIPFTKVGRHRRVMFEDLRNYKKNMKGLQKKVLIELMKSDQDTGMYDS